MLQETPFFRSWGGSWDTDYGAFFLGWYSGALLQHGEALMAAAAEVFYGARLPAAPMPAPDVNGGGGGALGAPARSGWLAQRL